MTGIKKIQGRKRQDAVDIRGNLHTVVVHGADIPDEVGADVVVDKLAGKYPRLNVVLGDAKYDDVALEVRVRSRLGARLEVVTRAPGERGFAVQPKRWIVEQACGCLGRNRRLAKDYERSCL